LSEELETERGGPPRRCCPAGRLGQCSWSDRPYLPQLLLPWVRRGEVAPGGVPVDEVGGEGAVGGVGRLGRGEAGRLAALSVLAQWLGRTSVTVYMAQVNISIVKGTSPNGLNILAPAKGWRPSATMCTTVYCSVLHPSPSPVSWFHLRLMKSNAYYGIKKCRSCVQTFPNRIIPFQSILVE
jgi:hypothetical protein